MHLFRSEANPNRRFGEIEILRLVDVDVSKRLQILTEKTPKTSVNTRIVMELVERILA